MHQPSGCCKSLSSLVVSREINDLMGLAPTFQYVYNLNIWCQIIRISTNFKVFYEVPYTYSTTRINGVYYNNKLNLINTSLDTLINYD